MPPGPQNPPAQGGMSRTSRPHLNDARRQAIETPDRVAGARHAAGGSGTFSRSFHGDSVMACLRHEQLLPGGAARLEVVLRAPRLGERVAGADANVEPAVGDPAEQLAGARLELLAVG